MWEHPRGSGVKRQVNAYKDSQPDGGGWPPKVAEQQTVKEIFLGQGD